MTEKNDDLKLLGSSPYHVIRQCSENGWSCYLTHVTTSRGLEYEQLDVLQAGDIWMELQTPKGRVFWIKWADIVEVSVVVG